ncbi:hypothetical protein LCGC14_2613440, partial [marine sediment metagenome]
MAVIKRRQHFTDTPVSGRNRRRIISNWSNWWDTRQNNYVETDQSITQDSVPYDWQGNYDFQRQILNGPCQIFLGDSTDAVNTALWGMRRADNPAQWVNFKLLNVNSVSPTFNLANRAAIWTNIQQNTDMILQALRHGVRHWMRIRGARPLTWRIAVRQPPGYGFAVHNSSWVSFMDDQGIEYFRTKPKYGVSGTLSEPSDLDDIFSVIVEEGNLITVGGKTFRTLIFTPDANAVADILQAGNVAWVD